MQELQTCLLLVLSGVPGCELGPHNISLKVTEIHKEPYYAFYPALKIPTVKFCNTSFAHCNNPGCRHYLSSCDSNSFCYQEIVAEDMRLFFCFFSNELWCLMQSYLCEHK